MRTSLESSGTTSETRAEGSKCTACQAPVQRKPIAHIYTDRYKHRLPQLQRHTMLPAPSEARLRLLTVKSTQSFFQISANLALERPGSCRSRRMYTGRVTRDMIQSSRRLRPILHRTAVQNWLVALIKPHCCGVDSALNCIDQLPQPQQDVSC